MTNNFSLNYWNFSKTVSLNPSEYDYLAELIAALMTSIMNPEYLRYLSSFYLFEYLDIFIFLI